MLDIRTFDNRQGGNVLYKALAHPLAAARVATLHAGLPGPVFLFDPDNVGAALLALYPIAAGIAGVFVQDLAEVGQLRCGHQALPITDLPHSGAGSVLVCAFDAEAILGRLAHILPPGCAIASLDALRLPEALLTNKKRALDPLNYATNFVFFREQSGLSTRLVSANYWANYGAKNVRLWLRLFDAQGAVLQDWEETVPEGPGGIVLDSAEIRARFALPEFTGQLFLHVIGAAGHDVVKYALDTYASDGGPSLSCTHDANAWPAERYAGLPAPRSDERVILWVQNSHATPIPAGALSLDRMGAEQPLAIEQDVPPFATLAVDVGAMLPELRWPAQIELRAGRHVVRPRYEIIRGARTRIAHVNVERADLKPDPALPDLPLGRGYLLPFPILPRARFRTIFQPTPMAISQETLPLRLDVFDPDGRCLDRRFLGNLVRDHELAETLDGFDVGHAELVYDFRDGGAGDGWLHTLVRYEDRATDHAAETSFGAHIYNTLMVWRGEPQSYRGNPPGLTTRLFLKLGDATRRSFTHLIYPSSLAWHAQSRTHLLLHNEDGNLLADREIRIACSGSALIVVEELFSSTELAAAGRGGYVLIRDLTCRLFGYHGLMDASGGFSLDHMFGF